MNSFGNPFSEILHEIPPWVFFREFLQKIQKVLSLIIQEIFHMIPLKVSLKHFQDVLLVLLQGCLKDIFQKLKKNYSWWNTFSESCRNSIRDSWGNFQRKLNLQTTSRNNNWVCLPLNVLLPKTSLANRKYQS